MFAVMKTGGKQYRVAAGDVLRVERIDADTGERVQFNDVLMVDGTIGTPTVAGAAVQADVIDQIRGEKVIHFVKRRRKHGSKRTKGHRQHLTLLRVAEILSSGADASGVKAAVGTGGLSRAAPAAAAAVTGAAPKAKAAPAAKAEAKPAPEPKAAPKPAPKPKAAPKAKAAPAPADGADLSGERPANLLDEARGGQPDDLKKISGVGPKLEGLLHQNGVFHFDQIAAWGEDEVAYMDDKLSFKGRIARDNWIEQAATFAAEQE